MSDANNDLVAKLARRGDAPTPEPAPKPTGDWNAPIDTVQADSMTAVAVVRGEFGDLKDAAWGWDIRPMPDDFDPWTERAPMIPIDRPSAITSQLPVTRSISAL